MYRGLTVQLIIPTLDEEESIGAVLDRIDRELVDQIVVGDNGSTDRTREIAGAHGALVTREPRRGYGSACMRALEAGKRSDLIAFMDGDGSDDPTELEGLLATLLDAGADLVIGSRVLGEAEAGALTPVQTFGNALTCTLLRWFWGVRHTDLGPFRVVRREALDRLAMADPDFGWTIEMQVKAVQLGMCVVETAVTCHRRQAGESKVSGNWRASIRAGRRILGYVVAAKLEEWFGGRPGRRAAYRTEQPSPRTEKPSPPARLDERLLVFTRYPEAGRSKTRLIPALGAEGAAELHDRLARQTVQMAREFCRGRDAALEIHFTGGDDRSIRDWLGGDVDCVPQAEGDLGARLADAFERALGGTPATSDTPSGRRVLVIGTDCPELDARLLAEALDALERNDVVLGPAEDGGYYLIGLRVPEPALFDGIAWGGDRVLADTVARAEAKRLRVCLTEPLRDIDRPEDLCLVESLLPAGSLLPDDATRREQG